MRYLLGFCLLMGSLCGLSVSLLGSVVITSTLVNVSGLELSFGIFLFSVITFFGSVYVFSKD